MYTYIRQWPKDREMGWSEEANGVCHDANNWFFTQDGNLWKFPITHRIGDTCKSENRAKGIYKVRVGKHLGDIDHYNGYIFVPVDSDKKTIRIYRASDLTLVNEQVMKRSNGTDYTSIGWLAINPNNGLLYTSDNTVSNVNSGKKSYIHIYKIGDVTKQNPLTLHSVASLKDEYNNNLERGCMQGGCFDDSNNLYLVNGYVTGKSDYHKGGKGGISVVKATASPAANSNMALIRVSHSNQSNGFRFQFNGIGDEPEGITYWDLDRDKRAPEIDGQLHAIMIDNCGTGADDFYFKHYRRNFSSRFYKVSVKIGNITDAGSDADLFITFYGANGRSMEYNVGDSPADDLEKGHLDSYVVEVTDNVGELKQILIRSNNKGKNASLYIEYITVQDLETMRVYNFTCNNWFATDKGDKKLSRYLNVN